MNANVIKKKIQTRQKRKLRIRSKIAGTAVKPRVTLFRSNRYLTAQAIDDTLSVTLAAIDGKKEGLSANIESATKMAATFATRLKEKGISAIVFDRNGYEYHGVVAAFGEALRSNEIKF
ncbi:MAG: 50S ribosomal protein L18 [Sulfuricurvum sp. PC08-66]|nr:MAG: 50S ribosomal protein L18 [Sulfuricurvum sp. PC08-66]